MSTRFAWLAVPAAAAATVAPAWSAGLVKVTYRDTIPKSGSGQVTVTTRTPASFSIVLRVPTQGRARLYLSGAKAPRGGPLVDTGPSSPRGGCEGAAGSFYCRASYEPLPRGTYTWRIVWKGPARAPVELTVRW